ncbi:MAG: Sjogren's syndrome/scleroderma autoantigen 1 family protein [Methanomicrobiales archaeon]|nr:Sjogren's syndrome/scleroderma autoantigen 1 family protein [Methanomicrobiales archaeon]
MEEKTPEELMAECLLKGGRMLAKACSGCGAPLFEYGGETRCVVCNPLDAPKSVPQVLSGPGHVQAKEGYATVKPEPVDAHVAAELSTTLIDLCRRIRQASDTGECLELMKCISTGVEALRRLLIP